MTAGIAFRVYGKPITQGSKTRTQYGMHDDNAKTLKPWRRAVTASATDASQLHPQMTGPVFVRATFSFDRPLHHHRTGRNANLLRDGAPTYPIARGKGDLDKLVRAVLDGITDSKLWADDAQVVDLRARKVWSGEHELALDRAGVRIDVVPLEAVPMGLDDLALA